MGKRTGNWTEYTIEGIIQSKENWQNGMQIGKWEYYYPNGNLKSEIVYKNALPIIVKCYDIEGNKLPIDKCFDIY